MLLMVGKRHACLGLPRWCIAAFPRREERTDAAVALHEQGRGKSLGRSHIILIGHTKSLVQARASRQQTRASGRQMPSSQHFYSIRFSFDRSAEGPRISWQSNSRTWLQIQYF